MLLWWFAGAALLAALLAAERARRLAKRLDRMREAYWDLRYEHGQLRARVTRLEPADVAAPGPANPEQPAGATAFVPLSSLKR